MIKTHWYEKYRPKTLDDYIFQDKKHELAFLQMVADGSIPHLLFSGVQGSGKTTLARLLISELGVDPTDVLTINGSDENNVDTVRDKIKNFVTTFAMSGYKIINIDEFDYFSLNGQAILRTLMEDYENNARFILTCNYINRIMEPIRSRCQRYVFKSPDKDDVAEYAAKILVSEKIKFTLPQLDTFIAIGYPDIRAIVNLLEQHSITGQLQTPTVTSDGGDYKFDLLEMMQTDTWVDIRKMVCQNVVGDEWESVYRFLYDNLEKSPKFSHPKKWEEGILVIAEHLYKHSLVADPEINAAAMFIKMEQI